MKPRGPATSRLRMKQHSYQLPKQKLVHTEWEAWKTECLFWISDLKLEKKLSNFVLLSNVALVRHLHVLSGLKSTDSDAAQMHIQVDKRQSIHAPAQIITYLKLEFQWLHVLRWHTWKLQRVRSEENIPNWELYWGHLNSKFWFRLFDFGQNFRKQLVILCFISNSDYITDVFYKLVT